LVKTHRAGQDGIANFLGRSSILFNSSVRVKRMQDRLLTMRLGTIASIGIQLRLPMPMTINRGFGTVTPFYPCGLHLRFCPVSFIE
jgi:hypothetical protein